MSICNIIKNSLEKKICMPIEQLYYIKSYAETLFFILYFHSETCKDKTEILIKICIVWETCVV